MSMVCGGTGSENAADAEIQSLIEIATVKSEAEKKHGNPFAEYLAVSYTAQVVAGTNFFIKVHIGNNEFIHMRVFRPLPHTNEEPNLVSILPNKSESDPIKYF